MNGISKRIVQQYIRVISQEMADGTVTESRLNSRGITSDRRMYLEELGVLKRVDNHIYIWGDCLPSYKRTETCEPGAYAP